MTITMIIAVVITYYLVVTMNITIIAITIIIILIPIIAIIHHVRSVGCLGVVSRRTGTAPNREARKVWLVAWVDASIILNINPNIRYNFRASG